MTETLANTELISLPEIVATDEDVIAYLRYSHKIAEYAVLAERNAFILNICQQFNLTVTDEELQTVGDAFRLEHKLLGVSETLAWLQQQRITVDDWSQGIRLEILTKKLKEYLFGDAVDAHYLSNRKDYQRVALSQILVSDLTEAKKVTYAIQESNESFCALALEYSKGKQSKQNGGFVGVRFLSELMPEIAQAISQAKEGEAIGPIHTKLGYHILKIEKCFPTEFSESREQVLESLFQNWLQANTTSTSGTEQH
ncbi:peptidylprolyl isomerase [Dendronalium sp. ChiSLP03b]|uniref:peptidylprolyl isomerase n=1 Tax=Dendronalium sp. ChiSLP03b TaxID=3075381 RepID=UPI002AD3B99A|nr:peptidylprolyl isomerase [Dendronalium sp. ChiSLP03b]MDZ8206826.1 peptidylprolyl isomerase [Dendronalium sp. ChiSLP03b]